jgi:hypothetical protein
MAHTIEIIFGGVTLLLVFMIGVCWGVAVVPALFAVITATLYADAKRDGM